MESFQYSRLVELGINFFLDDSLSFYGILNYDKVS